MATRTRQEYLKDLANNYTVTTLVKTGQKFCKYLMILFSLTYLFGTSVICLFYFFLLQPCFHLVAKRVKIRTRTAGLRVHLAFYQTQLRGAPSAGRLCWRTAASPRWWTASLPCPQTQWFWSKRGVEKLFLLRHALLCLVGQPQEMGKLQLQQSTSDHLFQTVF